MEATDWSAALLRVYDTFGAGKYDPRAREAASNYDSAQRGLTPAALILWANVQRLSSFTPPPYLPPQRVQVCLSCANSSSASFGPQVPAA